MELKLRLHVAPISVNSMYYGERRHGKRPEAINWSEQVLYSLRNYETEFLAINKLFNPKKHSYSITLIMNVPRDIFYTKAGEMSSRVIDLSNFEKPTIDLLMLKKFYGTNYPKQAINLNTDDRYLRKLISEKVPADEWSIDVIIRMEHLPSKD